MERYNFWSYESRIPVVQTWQPSFSRYQSPYEYTCDSTIPRIAKLWEANPRQSNGEYSSIRKAFYPVVPYNTQSFHYLPVMGHFDFTRLRQTNPLDLIYSQRPAPNQFGVVSLSNTISPLLHKMGTMEDLVSGESLGTCTLIAKNLVLVARHAIQGINIQNIQATFGYTEFNGSFSFVGYTRFNHVIEEDISCDYAIVTLRNPIGERLGYVPLSIADNTLSEPALLHYPLGKTLRVSVHTFVQTQYRTSYLLAYHDSDYFSSGGAYFDPLGRMTAMHLGSQLEGGHMNVLRYAMPLKDIVRSNPHSILQKFARGELSQANSYTSRVYKTYLSPVPHNYLMDEEGYQSEKVLRKHLGGHLKQDKKIKFTKSGAISFSTANLKYIASNYPSEYRDFREECLGMVGVHSLTKQYSVKGVIESDHTIPHDVWKSTTNPKMKKFLTGGGTRPGENDMPAITIPYDRHRELRTTGSSKGAKAFRQSLVNLCNNDKIDDALILCFEEYRTHGINLTDYRTQVQGSLDEHVKLGVISTQQKQKVTKALF